MTRDLESDIKTVCGNAIISCSLTDRSFLLHESVLRLDPNGMYL